MIGSRGSPTEDIGWRSKAAWICGRADGVESRDQLLIKVSSQRHWPAGDLFKGLASKRETRVEPTGGVFFLNLAGVVAEDLRRFGPKMTVHGRDMAADVMGQVDVVVFPNHQNLTPRESGQSIELLRQRSEAALDATDLPAVTGLILQFASVVEHDEFASIGRIVLGQKTGDGVLEQLWPPTRGTQTTHKWQLTQHATPPVSGSISRADIRWIATTPFPPGSNQTYTTPIVVLLIAERADLPKSLEFWSVDLLQSVRHVCGEEFR